MTPRELYSALRYQLAPVGASTWGPCANGCGAQARGSATCEGCLIRELTEKIPAIDWTAFVEAMKKSRYHILIAEEEIEWMETYGKNS